MKINVLFEAQLREVAGVPATETDLPDETTVLSALLKVVDGSGSDALRSRLITDNQTLQPGVLVFVNDQPVTSADTQTLSDGDTILLLPPISGG